jgi:hypothetical protein
MSKPLIIIYGADECKKPEKAISVIRKHKRKLFHLKKRVKRGSLAANKEESLYI